jgi:hypothetical protein
MGTFLCQFIDLASSPCIIDLASLAPFSLTGSITGIWFTVSFNAGFWPANCWFRDSSTLAVDSWWWRIHHSFSTLPDPRDRAGPEDVFFSSVITVRNASCCALSSHKLRVCTLSKSHWSETFWETIVHKDSLSDLMWTQTGSSVIFSFL